jgi:hypothetical protein
MEDYYKDEYEKTYKLLLKNERELDFYRNLTNYICGMTGTFIVMIVIPIIVGLLGYLLHSNWQELSLSNKITIVPISITLIGLFLRYRKLIFNWPEELYLKSLSEKKRKEELIK